MARWLTNLEKKIEQYSLESNPFYRVFISAEAAGSPETHIMPQGLLESAIKITNEPPTGMFANLHKALDNFNQVTDFGNIEATKKLRELGYYYFYHHYYDDFIQANYSLIPHHYYYWY